MDIRRRRVLLIAKWFCYLLMFILAAVLQTMPGFLTIGGVKPVLILPLCLSVSLFEGEYVGAIFGAFGGLVWDLLSGRVMGFFAIGVMFSCFVVSVLAQLFLKENSTNLMLMTAAAMLFITGYDFLFGYIMPGYSGVLAYYVRSILPMTIFTSAISPLILLCVKKIYTAFIFEE
ncbi:MAG: rod shape-determining protein MreD [Oscillospiraceae bacterium]